MDFSEYDSAPNSPNSARRAALLRLRGETQTDVADELDVSRRTVIRWEASDWWDDMVDEVIDEFHSDLVEDAYREIRRVLTDPDIRASKDARWLLERLGDDDLMHPRDKAEKEALEDDVDDEDDDLDFLEELPVERQKEILEILEEAEEEARKLAEDDE
jgi:transcriptional regulator with XRE-family HTH domain